MKMTLSVMFKTTMTDLSITSTAYIPTGYFIPRAEDMSEGTYDSYSEFVLRTRLVPMFPNLNFSFETLPEGNTIAPDIDFKETPSTTITEQKTSGESVVLPEGTPPLPKDRLYVVIVDESGMPINEESDDIERVRVAVKEITTSTHSQHALLKLDDPPVGISKTWWISEVSYLDLSTDYSPVYIKGGSWLLNLSAFQLHQDVYDKLNLSIVDQLKEKWKSRSK